MNEAGTPLNLQSAIQVVLTAVAVVAAVWSARSSAAARKESEQGRDRELEALLSQVGDLLFAAGRADQAPPEETETLLEQAQLLRPNSAKVKAWKSAFFLASERLALAKEVALDATRTDPTLAFAHMTLARVLARTGELEAALDRFDHANTLDDESCSALVNKGVALVNAERHDEALEAFDLAVEKEPANPRAHSNRGALLQGLGRGSEAHDALNRAVELDPEDSDARSNLGGVLHKLGLSREARFHLDFALQRNPSSALLLANLGAVEAELGNSAEARDLFNRAFRIRPRDPQLCLDLARTEITEGLFEDGLRHAEEAVRLGIEPESKAHLQIALALLHLRHPEEALKHARRVEESTPDAPGLAALLADALRLSGDHVAALPFAEQAVQEEPDNEHYLQLLGGLLARQRHFQAALGPLRKAAALGGNTAQLWNDLGLSLAMLGDAWSARDCYLRANRLAPDEPMVMANVASASYALRDFEGAKRWCQATLSLDPHCLPALDVESKLRRREGLGEHSQEHLEEE